MQPGAPLKRFNLNAGGWGGGGGGGGEKTALC